MAVLDLKTFNLLKESMGGDIIFELVKTFFRDTDTQIGQMREAIATKDADTFRRAAHSLKSSAATLGATDLSALARELEIMGQQNNFEVGNRLGVLNEAFEQVKEALKGLESLS